MAQTDILFVYLFISTLYYGTVNKPDYVESNDRITDKQ